MPSASCPENGAVEKTRHGKTHTRGGNTGEEAHKRLEEEIAEANEDDDDDD